MKTITLSKFNELVEHEDWTHSQEILWIEDNERTEMDEGTVEGAIITGGYGAVQKTSILGSVKINYIANFEYDDFEPCSLKIHDAGDYDWNIEGIMVVDKDGEELDIIDLSTSLPAEFSEIDYSFLDSKLRPVTGIDDSDEEGRMFTIPVSNAPDIRFVGEKIAGVSSSKHRGSEFYSGKTGRWTELHLYKTKGGKYVCQQIGRTEWSGEYDRHSAKVCKALEDVKEFFGFGWLAKRLYGRAEIDYTVLVD